MREFIKKIRKSGAVLEQYYKRFYEKNNLALNYEIDEIKINCSGRHNNGPLSRNFRVCHCFQFTKLHFSVVKFNTT